MPRLNKKKPSYHAFMIDILSSLHIRNTDDFENILADIKAMLSPFCPYTPKNSSLFINLLRDMTKDPDKYFIENKLDFLNSVDKALRQFISVANEDAKNDYIQCVEENLLVYGSEENYYQTNLVQYAIENNVLSIMQFLAPQLNFNNIIHLSQDNYGELLLLCSKHGFLNAVQALLINDVKFKHIDLTVSFFWASTNGHLAIVRLLLATQKININIIMQNGETALFMAVQNNHLEVVQDLLAIREIDVNIARTTDGCTPLIMAASNNNTNILKLLLSNLSININQACYDGDTSLLSAIKNNNLEMVKILLRYPAINPVTTTLNNISPFSYALLNNQIHILKELIKHNAVRGQLQLGNILRSSFFLDTPSEWEIIHTCCQSYHARQIILEASIYYSHSIKNLCDKSPIFFNELKKVSPLLWMEIESRINTAIQESNGDMLRIYKRLLELILPDQSESIDCGTHILSIVFENTFYTGRSVLEEITEFLYEINHVINEISHTSSVLNLS